ncbi:HPr-rel-A system PqqD family peptide chaperone [Azoarcus indigens]|uniref:HPr-rel-A system PqqD family peptide chaperone n=1 Tax=Azoarcus indigens TaxID=29545 RepID=UPI0013C2BF49|nr:HPr-rel-A system PqqD family peptide chaperone [Azoarcus indigens]
MLFHKASGATHHLPPLASYLLGELLHSPASSETLSSPLLDDDKDRGILSGQIDETLDDLCRLGLISRHL